MNTALVGIDMSESSVERALLEAQGDLWVTAQSLGHVTVSRLDRVIRASERLQRVALGIQQVKLLPEYDKMSQEQMANEVLRRLAVYRVDALDSMHELATMDTTDNSAMAQVKLAAAARLMGPVGPQSAEGGELEQILSELKNAYQEHAPRIKVTRETRTSIEVGNSERTIEGESSTT